MGDREEPPVEIFDAGDSFRDVARLIEQVRKISQPDEALKTYIGLLIQMGTFSIASFEKLSAQNIELLNKYQDLVGVILAMQVEFAGFNLQKVKVESRERTHQRGIDSAKEVLNTVINRIDPDVVNDLVRDFMAFMREKKKEGGNGDGDS